MKDKLEVVVAAIKKSRNVMICSHVDPDGDSIGSQMAMAGLLKYLGKQTAIVNRDPVPTKYKFLDPQGLVRDQLPEGFNPDTMV
ncbi:bifunctional oligoribonuclease/PAP phosphatase NrnA, partial [bacterium]|nr:bifunctional oligoribonuclease/PAP phosphatase NrnA [bacterium]